MDWEEEEEMWREKFQLLPPKELGEIRDRVRSRIAGADGRGRFDAVNPTYRIYGPMYRAAGGT